jgi:hypothetical protein
VPWDLRRIKHVLADAILSLLLHNPLLAVWGAALSAIGAVWAHIRLDPHWVYFSSGAFSAFTFMALAGFIAQHIRPQSGVPSSAARVQPREPEPPPIAPPAGQKVSEGKQATQQNLAPGTAPTEIRRLLNSLPPRQREYLAQSYIGERVEWEGEYRSAMPRDNKVHLFLRVGRPMVGQPYEWAWAIVESVPGLGLLSVGERGVVTGTITGIGENFTLDPAVFTLIAPG